MFTNFFNYFDSVHFSNNCGYHIMTFLILFSSLFARPSSLFPFPFFFFPFHATFHLSSTFASTNNRSTIDTGFFRLCFGSPSSKAVEAQGIRSGSEMQLFSSSSDSLVAVGTTKLL